MHDDDYSPMDDEYYHQVPEDILYVFLYVSAASLLNALQHSPTRRTEWAWGHTGR
jgi:hypothetical protein